MKVLLIGATGNVGCRLVPALLTHGHNVTAYVRSASKLESLLPPATYRQVTVIEGDAMNSNSIKHAILSSNADAVVNSAGVAAMAPWGTSDLPKIFRAVLTAVKEAGGERRRPLRVWFMAGLGVLNFPGTDSMLSSYIPIFLEHRGNIAVLRDLPPNAVHWSMLCPSNLLPESTDFSIPAKSTRGKLVANAMTPPRWQDSWLRHIPLIGKIIVAGMNATRYDVTLEQVADFIASDLESGEDQYVGIPVGVIDPSK